VLLQLRLPIGNLFSFGFFDLLVSVHVVSSV
jgi:hypothetical protein